MCPLLAYKYRIVLTTPRINDKAYSLVLFAQEKQHPSQIRFCPKPFATNHRPAQSPAMAHQPISTSWAYNIPNKNPHILKVVHFLLIDRDRHSLPQSLYQRFIDLSKCRLCIQLTTHVQNAHRRETRWHRSRSKHQSQTDTPR